MRRNNAVSTYSAALRDRVVERWRADKEEGREAEREIVS